MWPKFGQIKVQMKFKLHYGMFKYDEQIWGIIYSLNSILIFSAVLILRWFRVSMMGLEKIRLKFRHILDMNIYNMQKQQDIWKYLEK